MQSYKPGTRNEQEPDPHIILKRLPLPTMFGLLQRTPLRVFYNAFRGLSANVWLLALVTFISQVAPWSFRS